MFRFAYLYLMRFYPLRQAWRHHETEGTLSAGLAFLPPVTGVLVASHPIVRLPMHVFRALYTIFAAISVSTAMPPHNSTPLF